MSMDRCAEIKIECPFSGVTNKRSSDIPGTALGKCLRPWSCIYIYRSMPADVTSTHRVPGEIKKREVELDPQVSPEEIMSREVELGCESWTSFASSCCLTAVQRTLSL